MVQSILNFPPTKVVFNSPGEFLARGGGNIQGEGILSQMRGDIQEMEFPPHYAIFSPYIRAIKYIIIRRVETMSEYQFTYSI